MLLEKVMIRNKMTIKALRETQQDHLIQALLRLKRYTIYATIDSSLAVPGEIDRAINQLELLVQQEVENKGGRAKNKS